MLARAVARLPAASKHSQRCEAVIPRHRHTCAPTTSSRAWSTAAIPPSSALCTTAPHPIILTLTRPPISSNDLPTQTRPSSSTSSTRWRTRQTSDSYARSARLSGLKSRAAFKLLEIDSKHHLFRRGDTVVDLGFAPGSWSQVAVSKTQPGGRVVGIDVIPAMPPRGANALQGNFLSEEIRREVREFVGDVRRGRVRSSFGSLPDGEEMGEVEGFEETEKGEGKQSQKEVDLAEGRVVNVVLSDMSEPWPLVASSWVKSVSNPYRRMLNTSGVQARDHGGSMDLCNAALTFAYDTLATGGHFLCKFYTGSEDHALELRLKKLFEKVYRIKPDATRKESKEAYFLGLRRKSGVKREDVILDEG